MQRAIRVLDLKKTATIRLGGIAQNVLVEQLYKWLSTTLAHELKKEVPMPPVSSSEW
jgi:hypothetical protein